MKQVKSNTIIPSFVLEEKLSAEGYTYIAGVDEAGRGALAGPLSVAMVVYRPALFHSDIPENLTVIRDSKQLSHAQRERALDQLIPFVASYHHVTVSSEIIDKKNINGATYYAVEQLLQQSFITPDIVIMDGNFNFSFDVPFRAVIKGDQTSLSIASASIVAKLNRDALMCEYDALYPEYGFKKHKGYGTKFHREVIKAKKGTPLHRKTYEPLKSLLF
jgi:ribonuclease HII